MSRLREQGDPWFGRPVSDRKGCARARGSRWNRSNKTDQPTLTAAQRRGKRAENKRETAPQQAASLLGRG